MPALLMHASVLRSKMRRLQAMILLLLLYILFIMLLISPPRTPLTIYATDEFERERQDISILLMIAD
jgi:hypothetical protein